MADLHPIRAQMREPIQRVIDSMNQLHELLQAFDQVAGESGPPPWLSCVLRSFESAHIATDELERRLIVDVLPLLERDGA